MPVTKNYAFRAFAPTVNLDSVCDQMRAAHRYRNKLCELELARRAASEATIRRLSPDYAALAEIVDAAESRVDDAYESVKAASRKARTRVPPTPEQTQEIADAKASREEAVAAAKEAKALAYERLKELQGPHLAIATVTVRATERNTPLTPTAEKRAIRAEYLRLLATVDLDAGQLSHEAATKEARAQCNCFWGTYLTVEDAASKFHVGAPPRFASWTGDGTIAVQLQGGLSVEDATAGKDTRLQIALSNAEELAVRGKSHCQRAVGVARMRIDSDGRAPVWTECRVVFHRPLPLRGVIKWAYLHRRIVGATEAWSLRVVIESPDDTAPPPDKGVVAVHPGYRLMANGSIRVASLAATRFPPELFTDPELSRYLVRDGDIVEVRLPSEHLSRRSMADSIAAHRDRLRDRRAPRLFRWLKDHADILPEWMIKDTETIASWKSQERFRRLCDRWYANRFRGDALALRLLHRWRRRDIHLHDYEFNLARKAAAWRTQLYRTLAKRLADHYAVVVVPKIDWKKMRQRPAPDEEITQVNRQRRIAGAASPGQLTEMLAEKCSTRLVVVSASKITLACAGCGHEGPWNRANRYHACPQCGDQWDQDHNAARNELARAIMLGSKPGPLAGEAAQGVDDSLDGIADDAETQKKPTSRKSRRNRRYNQVIESSP